MYNLRRRGNLFMQIRLESISNRQFVFSSHEVTGTAKRLLSCNEEDLRGITVIVEIVELVKIS